MATSGARITAVNAAAEAEGLAPGMAVADARAIYPALRIEAADEKGDGEALRRLALWCQCYSPFTRADAPDGLLIDITGCAHLFGGEVSMAESLADRLCGFGLTARIAIGPTIGASWAAARHGADAITHIPDGHIADYLAPLPVAGLRLDPETVSALDRLGLKRIGMLIDKPRAPLATRFGPVLAHRLDQALGREGEALDPLSPPPVYQAQRIFAEPLTTLPAIAETVRLLADDLAETLYSAGKAARRIELALYRVDGWRETLGLRTSSLSRDASHLARLLCERLDHIRDHAGFGFETAVLGAFDVEDADASQHEMAAVGTGSAHEDDFAQLLDRLVNRFGAGNVIRFVPQQSHLPERASRGLSVLDNAARGDWSTHDGIAHGATPFARPPLLFAAPEPVTVIVELPDRPPSRFEWRHISHRVIRAEGPERIAPEWWVIGDKNRQTRDYYRVENEAGQRFWLYRDGLYDRADDTPRWFIHGIFA